MPNEVTVFTTVFTTPAELGSMDVRVTQIDGSPVWRLDDLCRVLEIANPWNVARRLDEDETITLRIAEASPSGIVNTRDVTFVTEAGRYSVILLSRSPRAKPFKRWLTHEVLPSLRQHGIYVVGQEKVRTGERSISDLRQRAAEAWKSLAEALEVENKRVTTERDQFARVNTLLVEELTLVTIQEWKALNHVYLEACDTNRIAAKARALADARGIKLTKVDRDVPIGGGITIKSKVNVYPRELLDEAAAALGFNFMLKLPA
jgi:prophage antirepressor-like protein